MGLEARQPALPRGASLRLPSAGRLPRVAAPLAARLAVADLLALGAGLGMWALWSWMLVREHDTFHSFHRDLAIHMNVLWNLLHGHGFATTLLTRNDNLLAEHVWPILVPLAGL